MTSGDSGTNQPTGRARWQRRITATIVFSAVLAIAAISSCRKEPPAAKNTGQQQANVAQTVPEKATQMNGVKFEPAHAQSKEEQSCQEFVQKFYDWYVSRELEFECKHLKDTHHEDIDSLNSCRRASEFHSVEVMRLEQALSPKLKRLLDDDYAAQAKADEIVGMDGDPFLNGNAGVIYNYVVDSVQVKDGKCNATVNETGINGNGEEEGKIYDRIVPELVKTDGKWMIANLHYHRNYSNGSKEVSEDDDLISWLKRLSDDRMKPSN
jgi:hypothetical protein